MCGYCTERYALLSLIRENVPTHISKGYARALWLQETPNLNALDWMPMSALYIGEAISWIGRAVQLQIAGNGTHCGDHSPVMQYVPSGHIHRVTFCRRTIND